MNPAAPTVRAFQDRFVADVMPLVARRSRRAFWGMACPGRRADAEQEALLHAWLNFQRLAERGLADQVPVKSVAYYAVIRAKAGTKAHAGSHRGRRMDYDTLSWRSQRRGGFTVSQEDETTELEAGAGSPGGSRQASVVDQVSVRVDVLAWAQTRPEREQVAMRALAAGTNPIQVARRLGVSPAWVSKRRLHWRNSWEQVAG